MSTSAKTVVKELQISLIDEPVSVMRLEIDPEHIAELAESIASVGQLQPILVRPVNSRYEIIYGHCRYLAHKRLGRETIICTVRDLSDLDTSLMRATENIARKDISPVEEAFVYQKLIDVLGLTIDDIGAKMGKSPGVVRRRLDLLKMPPQLRNAVHKKQIPYSCAELIWSLGEIGLIDYYLGFAIENGASYAVVNEWVREAKAQKRQAEFNAEGSGGPRSPMESRPVYVPCDLCEAAMEIGQETVYRCCPACAATIKANM